MASQALQPLQVGFRGLEGRPAYHTAELAVRSQYPADLLLRQPEHRRRRSQSFCKCGGIERFVSEYPAQCGRANPFSFRICHIRNLGKKKTPPGVRTGGNNQEKFFLCPNRLSARHLRTGRSGSPAPEPPRRHASRSCSLRRPPRTSAWSILACGSSTRMHRGWSRCREGR